MAATFEFNEDFGTQTGSPLKGTSRATAVTQCNWKNAGDVSTSYSSAPIVAGSNSYTKYQFGKFSGSWNSILNGVWSGHTAGTSPMGTGLTLKGVVTSTYATPATTANSALTEDYSSTVVIGSGETVLFSATGPEDASPASSLSGGGTAYTQYLATQLQTTSGASPGDTATITATLRYDEA